MAAVDRVVKHAVFSYTDPDGVNRMAIRGEKISIEGAELERGERFNVFVDDEDDVVDPSGPLDGALVGDDEILDGIVEDVDLAAAVAGLDEEQRAALVAALAEAGGGVVSSPAGAQPTPLDEAAVAAAAAAARDELAGTGTVAGSEPELERPPLTANKSLWVDFRVRESGGVLDAAQLDADFTKPQLQDDALFVDPAAGAGAPPA